jgi:hypothetical protein
MACKGSEVEFLSATQPRVVCDGATCVRDHEQYGWVGIHRWSGWYGRTARAGYGCIDGIAMQR